MKDAGRTAGSGFLCGLLVVRARQLALADFAFLPAQAPYPDVDFKTAYRLNVLAAHTPLRVLSFKRRPIILLVSGYSIQSHTLSLCHCEFSVLEGKCFGETCLTNGKISLGLWSVRDRP